MVVGSTCLFSSCLSRSSINVHEGPPAVESLGVLGTPHTSRTSLSPPSLQRPGLSHVLAFQSCPTQHLKSVTCHLPILSRSTFSPEMSSWVFWLSQVEVDSKGEPAVTYNLVSSPVSEGLFEAVLRRRWPRTSDHMQEWSLRTNHQAAINT